jgi:hypothetical protein
MCDRLYNKTPIKVGSKISKIVLDQEIRQPPTLRPTRLIGL